MAEIRVMRDDLRPPDPPARRHLISIADLTRDDVERLLATARSFGRSLEREVKKLPTLRGRTVVNVFYESSTRTSSSFELAAKRLSADTMSIKAAGSSVDKGESLKDTALTLAAYDPDVIVIRHPQIGAPQLVARVTEAHVVNAGDGKHQHPTQALLDLYTIQEEFGRVEGLHVAIVGDVLHSRVARSNIQALVAPRRARHARRAAAAPAARDRGAGLRSTSTDIHAIAAADVVYVLRMQRERMQDGASYVPSLREYTAALGRHARAAAAGPEGHAPGPDEPRRRDRPGGRRRARVADRDPGCAPGSSCGWPCSTTCSRTGRSPLAALRSTRWPDALDEAGARSRHRHPRRPRARPGARASTRPSTCASTPGRSPRWATTSRRTATGWSRRASCSRRRSSTRTSTCGRPGARTRRRSPRARRGGRGRLLRDPGDAEHRPGRRLGLGPARARGDGDRGARPGRLPRGDLEGSRRAS